MPGNRVELAAVPDEGRLLDRHLVDQPVYQVPAAHRIRRRAEEGTGAEPWRGAIDGGEDGCLSCRWQGDPGLLPDEIRDRGEERLHRGTGNGSCRSASRDRKSTRLNSSHVEISYAVFCLKKKKKTYTHILINKNKNKTQ